jgi:hypothetical protein
MVSVRVHCHEDFVELETRAAEIRKSLGEKREGGTYYMAKPPNTV